MNFLAVRGVFGRIKEDLDAAQNLLTVFAKLTCPDKSRLKMDLHAPRMPVVLVEEDWEWLGEMLATNSTESAIWSPFVVRTASVFRNRCDGGLFPGGQRTLRSASPPSTPGRRRSIPPPAFRDAWRKGQRCLVVTDGFYEWKKPEKQPYAVAMADKSHMVMAGLWDDWTDKKTGECIRSCTIITCPSNALVGRLHDRMPVILGEEDWAKWLGEELAMNDELKALLVPFNDDALTLWPVDRQKIGNVRKRDREVVLPELLSEQGTG